MLYAFKKLFRCQQCDKVNIGCETGQIILVFGKAKDINQAYRECALYNDKNDCDCKIEVVEVE